MTRTILRTVSKRTLGALLRRRAELIAPEELAQTAVVFAPHPDDEALGCGGTILRKLACGAHVDVAFMTDGSTSHQNLMAPHELKSLRHDEAHAACAALGVAPERVHWFAFQDGNLEGNYDAALLATAALLSERRPAQVFIPYRHEGPADHRITQQIVLAALERVGLAVDVYEYPVWFWHHWPWVGFDPGTAGLRQAFQASLPAWFGLRLLKDFGVCVPLADVRELKRVALAAHQTQMTRLGGEDWPILGDVAEGEFLACFFGDREFFQRWRFLPGNGERPAASR